MCCCGGEFGSLKVSCNATLIDDNLYPLSSATFILQLIASQYKGLYIYLGLCQVPLLLSLSLALFVRSLWTWASLRVPKLVQLLS